MRVFALTPAQVFPDNGYVIIARRLLRYASSVDCVLRYPTSTMSARGARNDISCRIYQILTLIVKSCTMFYDSVVVTDDVSAAPSPL